MSSSLLNLHPEALEDLRRSGLSDVTIGEAGLYTPAPGDLPRLLSARLVERVQHVLVFPYDSAGHGGAWRRDDEFIRCKLFPPVSDGEGHTIRYYQRSGTPPRLYIPAAARAALADPSVPLLVTEGEKKALKASQKALACVAVGGLWNWQSGGRPIAELDRIDWCDRETLIVPDSDVWTRPDLLQPVFALGKELEARGAKVAVVKLPSGPGGAKVGLDDYLCVSSHEAFGALPRLPLKHAALGRATAWWREWVKRGDAESPEGEPTVLELLERGETTWFLHPALDVVDGVLRSKLAPPRARSARPSCMPCVVPRGPRGAPSSISPASKTSTRSGRPSSSARAASSSRTDAGPASYSGRPHTICPLCAWVDARSAHGWMPALRMAPPPPPNHDLTITNNLCDGNACGITLDPTVASQPEVIQVQRARVSGNVCQGMPCSTTASTSRTHATWW